MNKVKEFANKQTVTAVITFVLAIVFFASLPYFQREINALTYAVGVNTEDKPYYNEEIEEGTEVLVYDDQEAFDALTGEFTIRRGIGYGLLISTALLAGMGAYSIYRDRKLTEAAIAKRNQ